MPNQDPRSQPHLEAKPSPSSSESRNMTEWPVVWTSMAETYAPSGAATPSGLYTGHTTPSGDGGMTTVNPSRDPSRELSRDPEKGQSEHVLVYILCLVSFNAFIVSVFASVYLDAAEVIQVQYDVNQSVARLAFVLYILPWGLGPLIYAPIAERFGRKWVYVFSAGMWTIWHIGAARANNIATLTVCRFFAGLFGSACLTNGSGTSFDMFVGLDLAKTVAFYCLLVFLGPVCGPIIGPLIRRRPCRRILPTSLFGDGGWRWIFYSAIIAGFVTTILCAIGPETNHAVILTARAKKLRAQQPGTPYRSGAELDTMPLARKIFKTTAVAAIMLVEEPVIICLTLWQTTVLGIVYLFFEAYPVVYGDGYGFTPGQIGLAFIPIGIGMISCCLYSIFIDTKFYVRAVTKAKGVRVPEMRIPFALFSAILVPISLLWFGYTTYPSVHWIVSMLAAVLYRFSLIGVLLATFSYTVEVYGAFSSSAFAACGLVRFVATSTFPLFGSAMFQNLGPRNATLILACISLAEVTIPLTLQRFGPRIRAASKLAA